MIDKEKGEKMQEVKESRREYLKTWRSEHRDHIREYKRRWSRENPEKQLEYNRRFYENMKKRKRII